MNPRDRRVDPPGVSADGETRLLVELHALIHRERLHGEETLSTTALAQAAMLRLTGGDRPVFRDRADFLRHAAGAMRKLLVDQARDGHAAVCAPEATLATGADVLFLDRALNRLADVDPLLARLAELRLFTGALLDDCAVVFGMDMAEVGHQWRRARALLDVLHSAAGD